MHKFVDDTTISEIIACNKISRINDYVNEVVNWSRDNLMNINYLKTKEMVIGAATKYCLSQLSIDNNLIQRVQVFKLLGVLIDDKLNWKCHVNAMCSKAASKLYFLKMLKRSGVLESDLLYFYVAVIRSVLEYACPAWHNSLNVDQISRIEAIQKRAIAIIYGKVNYMEKCSKLDLPMLYDRRDLLCRSFFESVLNKNSCLHYLLPNIRDRDIIDKLRYTVLYDATKSRTVKYKQSFINFALEHYQSILI